MKTFKDNAGRECTIAINVDAIKRVPDLLDWTCSTWTCSMWTRSMWTRSRSSTASSSSG